MSKEKQCECCHEWWYDSDVKEDLCPNCYDYFKQLKQQLAEKDKEIEEKMMSFEKRCQEYYKSNEFKRDFAIQELEKVKEFIKNANGVIGLDWRIDRFKVIETIDNQIKVLKGE